MTVETVIADMISETITAKGFDLVRVKFDRSVMQVMIEPIDKETPMTVDDCAIVSRAISPLLDEVQPPITAYTLEVSSPGINRPLIKPEDFNRFAGEPVSISLKALIDGRRRIKGKLVGIDNNSIVTIDTQAGPVTVDLQTIDTASIAAASAINAENRKG